MEHFYNYKGLPFKESVKQFKRDYCLKYHLYGKYTTWETQYHEKIQVRKLHKKHLIRIVEYFGNTTIRTRYPFIWYRYLKEVKL